MILATHAMLTAVEAFTKKTYALNKDLVLRCFHAAVSVVILLSIISGIIFVETADIDWYKYEFLILGYNNILYLLSFWVSAFQIIYFNMYSAIDIIDIYSKQKPKLVDVKDRLHDIASYLLFMVVFPLSMVVTVLFWTFYWINRDVMYPPVMDDIFPAVLNHIMHTFPGIMAVIYMLTSNRKEPPKTVTLAGLLGLLSVYTACIVSIKIRNGRWVYLALEQLTSLQLRCTFAFSIIGSITFLFLGYAINDKLKVLRKKIMD